jgi:TM2 domain-containing membrane protein YozV
MSRFAYLLSALGEMPLMTPNDPIYNASMNEQQRAWFYAEYLAASKEEVVGVLLALFLGGFGVHKFYLRQNVAGAFYLIFSWTGIPSILGFFECFFMPGRVRAYNAAQAAYIASQILASTPPNTAATPPTFIGAGAIPTAQLCASCGQPLDPAAAFCPHCGAACIA